MIPRYTLAEMGAIWTEEAKFQSWLDVEIIACEAWAELGRIPPAAVESIRTRAGFDVKRIQEIEEQVHHDLLAFLQAVSEQVGEESRYIHLGLTSYDIEDTALAVRMRKAADLVLADLKELAGALRARAEEHKMTPMIGRTHGVHAQPITFGLKMALWLKETERNIERVERARESVSVGKLSGAVGTFANCPPRVEEYVCSKLGLRPAEVSTQIIQRDRHAEMMCVLALVAGSLEKFAVEIRNLQRTEIGEVMEPFGRSQKGSSAMPHKRNPIVCERVTGLARVVRGNAVAAMETIALWHERDLTNSGMERVVLPDSFCLVDYMTRKMTGVIKGMTVNAERMMKNLESSHGLVFSQGLLVALGEKGLGREETYRLVQRLAMESWEKETSFKGLVLKDEGILNVLSKKEIEACFDLGASLRHVGAIFKRL